MTQRIFILALLFILPFTMQAQFGDMLKNVKNSAKIKVQQRIEGKADKGMEDALDRVEGKGKSKESKGADGAAVESTAEGKESSPAIVSYSKFDFVPGNKVVYAEDFSQDEIGELPVGWNTNNRGEVITLSNAPGKWFRLVGGSKYLTANKDTFSRNFTMEFDLIYDITPTGYLLPDLTFGFLASNGEATNGNKFLTHSTTYAKGQVDLSLAPRNKNYTSSSKAKFISHLKGGGFFSSESKTLDDLGDYNKKVSHVAVQVQGSRLRCWVNSTKAFDLPMALPTDFVFNQLFFALESSNYKDDQLGYYISNIKVATGKPDTRHKFMDEGKFSTTGILFNVNSAVIKPESAGVLKEMATVLKENGSVKVKIIGHTDSDGDDKSNLELSKKRAAAVKAALESDFNIEADRIVTDGLGESKPVADNKTKEGKMQNRRVEFIKL
jgi:outer membrane protein OmpA-like peptidoglycan-associated protein